MKNNLPPYWSWIKLGNLTIKKKFAIVDGPFGTQMKVNDFVDSGIPVIEMENIKRDKFIVDFRRFITKEKFEEIKRSEVVADDLILSKTGSLGYLALVPQTVKKAIITSRLAKISVDWNLIEKSYLINFLIYIRDCGYWLNIAKGTTMKILNIAHLEDLEVPLPPIKDQKKIVEKIEELFSELDNGIENLCKTKEQIKTYKQSVLAFAFSGKLTRELRVENSSSVSLADGELPKDWKMVKLEDVSKIKGGKRLPKGADYSKEKTNYPYIRVIDMENMSVNIDNLKFITEESQTQIKNYIIEKKDLYISIAGSIGKVGKIPCLLDGANLTENAAKITEIKDFDLTFLCYYLNSESAQNQMIERTIATTQPKLALFRIEKIDVIQPPLEIQLEIVSEIERRFSVADKLEQTINDSLEKAEQMKQSILKQAFEGKLV